MSGVVWSSVDAIVDRSTRVDDLRAHGLHLLASRRWRQLERPVPPEIVLRERFAAMIALAAPAVLAEIRSAYGGRLLLQKGPELAARYPDPALRPYGDIDLLADDAPAAQAALLEAGWVPVRHEQDGFHHLQPLQSPRYPLRVEIHQRPVWLPTIDAPSFGDLFARAQPARVGVDGVLAPCPADHAVLVAVHAWLHEPLGRLLNLIDVALLAQEAPLTDIERAAAQHGATRVWNATMAVVDRLLLSERGAPPRALRRPLRHLATARERTVIESHVFRAAGIFVALPPAKAIPASIRVGLSILRPEPGESWASRVRRAIVTLSHLRRRRSDHENAIGYR